MIMEKREVLELIQKFEAVSRVLTNKWGVPNEWQELYGEMCCAFARENGNLMDKSFAYIIRVCKNKAQNSYFKGKSICSKPRRGLKVVSLEQLSETIPAEEQFEDGIHKKILVEKIMGSLTERERQVAEQIMEGETVAEMAMNLGISRQRINHLMRHLQEKVKRLKERFLLRM